MDNLTMYNKYAQPPQSALKNFNNGSFSGTDINPMWRIMVLTEEYGECGFGWYVEVLDSWREDSTKTVRKADGTIETITESTVYCKVALRVKRAEWSAPIIGIGGNTLAGYSKKKAEVLVSDESYKMAYTDALSNACKMLGIGSDVWWKHEPTKYTKPTAAADKPEDPPKFHCNDCGQEITETIINGKAYSASAMVKATVRSYGTALCLSCKNVRDTEIADINRDERLYAECEHEDAGDRD